MVGDESVDEEVLFLSSEEEEEPPKNPPNAMVVSLRCVVRKSVVVCLWTLGRALGQRGIADAFGLRQSNTRCCIGQVCRQMAYAHWREHFTGGL
jgi:hypothetical protein